MAAGTARGHTSFRESRWDTPPLAPEAGARNTSLFSSPAQAVVAFEFEAAPFT